MELTDLKRHYYSNIRPNLVNRYFNLSTSGICILVLEKPIPVDLPRDFLIRKIIDEAVIVESNKAFRLYAAINHNKAVYIEDLIGDPNDYINAFVEQGFALKRHPILEEESDGSARERAISLDANAVVEDGKLVAITCQVYHRHFSALIQPDDQSLYSIFDSFFLDSPSPTFMLRLAKPMPLHLLPAAQSRWLKEQLRFEAGNRAYQEWSAPNQEPSLDGTNDHLLIPGGNSTLKEFIDAKYRLSFHQTEANDDLIYVSFFGQVIGDQLLAVLVSISGADINSSLPMPDNTTPPAVNDREPSANVEPILSRAELIDLIDNRKPDTTHAWTGLIILNIRRFKVINNTLGHASGDIILEQIKARIRPILQYTEDGFIARTNGDEFAITLFNIDSQSSLASFTLALHEVLSERFIVNGVPLHISFSIGAALSTEDLVGFSDLYSCADSALIRSRRDRLNYCIFNPKQDHAPGGQIALLSEFRTALVNTDEVALHYQPQISHGAAKAKCYEALLRWQKPNGHIIPPSVFLSSCESSELINVLTERVIRMAAKDWRDVFSQNPETTTVAVNISTYNLSHPGFIDLMCETASEFNIPAGAFELEITESKLIQSSQSIKAQLFQLKQAGFNIVIDDFGVGYSSFKTLLEMPVDKIKIDRSFIRNACCSKKHAAIVVSLISLAKEMGIEVAAEGIEDFDTFWTLNNMGCDYYQGFYIQEPLPANAILDADFSFPDALKQLEAGFNASV